MVPCLFGLAPCGVYPALALTRQPVRSYRTFSPLPSLCFRLGLAVHSLLHLPSRWLEPSVPDVIRHTALRSSDFPPPLDTLRRERQRSSSRLHNQCTLSWAGGGEVGIGEANERWRRCVLHERDISLLFGLGW
jgi:hypothetical protein